MDQALLTKYTSIMICKELKRLVNKFDQSNILNRNVRVLKIVPVYTRMLG